MKLIDVNVLKEWVENWFTKNRFYHPYAKNNNIPITELYDILEQMPTIEERKTGEWIPIGVRHGWVCSNCKKEDVYAFSINETGDYEMQDFFCPNCGADMTRGEENG